MDFLQECSEQTLREVQALYKLRRCLGGQDKKAIEKDIKTKLGVRRFAQCHTWQIRHHLKPYPAGKYHSVNITQEQADYLSKMSRYFTGSSKVESLIEAIVNGDLKVLPNGETTDSSHA
jgi:hypothetical protein